MTEEITNAPPETKTERTTKENPHDLVGSQRVYKKSSANSMLTIYIPTRELISRNGVVAPLKGVLYADPKFVQGHRIFGQLTLTFRYGREDEEVMGLRFCNEAVMCLTQVWPPPEKRNEDILTPLQDALIKRLGEGAHPFTMEVTPQAPPSVQLVPAKRYYGAPIGTSYDIRCFVADRSDEKLHRRSTVRMGIRLIHKSDGTHPPILAPENFTTMVNNLSQNGQSTSPPCSSTSMTTSTGTTPTNSARSKSERIDSFSKLKLSPKAFRFTGKLCRSKSEIEKGSHDHYEGIVHDLESSRGPQGSIDKPFLLQEGKVGLRASLDKSMYAHGENVVVTVDIKNDSRKTVRRIKVSAIQHVDVCMFSNGKFKNIVAESEPNSTDVTCKPGTTLHRSYSLQPQRGPTKNWIALEDSLQRCNEPNAINALIATSALRAPPTNLDDRNVFAIYVSYYIKVKLTLSGMGGELSLKLPFTLAHIDRDNLSDTNSINLENAQKSSQQQQQQQQQPQSSSSSSQQQSKQIKTPDTIESDTSCTNDNLLKLETNFSAITITTQATITAPNLNKNNNYNLNNKNNEIIDKIEPISDDLRLVERENSKSKRMLRNNRSSTIQISSVEEDKSDDDCIVGTTASDILNSPDVDLRTETTCVEVHASSS